MKAMLQPKTEEFEQLYEERFTAIYNYVYFRVGNPQTAEDLTADIFVRAYNYWDSYASGKGEREKWLWAITHNAIKTHFKKVMQRPQYDEWSEFLCADVDIEDSFIQKEDVRLLLAHIRRMPEEKQELLSMKYFLRMTNREIAKATGMSESNVGTTLHKLIGKLRKIYREHSDTFS